jgi:hypothetical protein
MICAKVAALSCGVRTAFVALAASHSEEQFDDDR